jgi:hypothetical protein
VVFSPTNNPVSGVGFYGSRRLFEHRLKPLQLHWVNLNGYF